MKINKYIVPIIIEIYRLFNSFFETYFSSSSSNSYFPNLGIIFFSVILVIINDNAIVAKIIIIIKLVVFIVYPSFSKFAASCVYVNKEESTEFINIFIPIPQLIAAKAVIIPACGFLFPYLNNNADIGINTM